MLGDYAKAKIHDFSEEKFNLYKELIAENDWDLYGWVIGKQETPEKFIDLIEEIKEFSFRKYKN